jgi:hypothetical protein
MKHYIFFSILRKVMQNVILNRTERRDDYKNVHVHVQGTLYMIPESEPL